MEQRTEVVHRLREWESRSLQKVRLFKHPALLTYRNCSNAYLVCCGLKFWRCCFLLNKGSVSALLCVEIVLPPGQHDMIMIIQESDCHPSHSIVSACLFSIKLNRPYMNYCCCLLEKSSLLELIKRDASPKINTRISVQLSFLCNFLLKAVCSVYWIFYPNSPFSKWKLQWQFYQLYL